MCYFSACHISCNTCTGSTDEDCTKDASGASDCADGYTDNLVLERYYPNVEEKNAGIEKCNFIGHLENEKSACGSVYLSIGY